MKDFPSCFGENGVQVGEASSETTTKTAQNLVTCVYQCKMRNSSYVIITLTWTKNLMGQSLSVEINDSNNLSLCKLDIKPWLFSKRRGFRTIQAGSGSGSGSGSGLGSKLIDIYWDLTYAKFGSSPEPTTGFYFAIAINRELILVLGDMEKEVHKKIDQDEFSNLAPNAVFVSKRAYMFGKKAYSTRAQFCGKGQVHEILIECDTMGVNLTDDSCLVIRIDGNPVMQVKCLRWKFRGNYTILVDGLPVEVYWDVHSWLFEKLTGNAVFLFKTCLSAEKLWASEDECWSKMLSKDGGQSQGLGFSLVLCVWKSE
ncbi:hypothetical protein HanRHA438_Chr04g0188351 [Helianthus annuus]|nr:hypothetical protein HanHA300_Chr04g0146211 [Helianthus annuus]KAJ0589986.1 hypothetical protein HanIR_Chr04g0192421 [Helianthus annuus]KAJ0597871.1 hypothetical protein HanHA89_Chr04g0159561 [Helianthus annuus]KAJ0927922.1 hypothetical protein HanRHA438_Chr04g0188351 [Helianthus annuus]